MTMLDTLLTGAEVTTYAAEVHSTIDARSIGHCLIRVPEGAFDLSAGVVRPFAGYVVMDIDGHRSARPVFIEDRHDAVAEYLGRIHATTLNLDSVVAEFEWVARLAEAIVAVRQSA